MPKPATAALESLSAAERAGTLTALLSQEDRHAVKDAGLDVPDDWLVEQCPAWAR
jgi:hypothetical protein